MFFNLFRFTRLDSFEDSYFRISRFILGFLGCWPLAPLNRLTQINIGFNMTVLLTSALGELRATWLLRRNIMEALDALSPCITKFVTWAKLLCFVIYRKDMEFVLKNLFEHCKTDTQNPKKKTLIGKVSYFANTYCTLLFMNAIATSILFGVKPLIIWCFQYFVNGKRNTWVDLPFRFALPYEDMTRLNNKFIYAVIYGWLTTASNVATFAISGTDGAFLCFCTYLSAAFQCLQEDFKSTFEAHALKKQNGSKSNIYGELSQLIKRQQKIFEIFESFNRVYKFVIFLHFVSTSVLLAILLINLVLTSGAFKIVYVLYANGIMQHLFACCFGAESVNENCLKLSEALYFCDWYNHSKKVKLLVLFALTKSQKGSPMKAPFFSPSMQLFASIIQTTVSYFTILQTFL